MLQICKQNMRNQAYFRFFCYCQNIKSQKFGKNGNLFSFIVFMILLVTIFIFTGGIFTNIFADEVVSRQISALSMKSSLEKTRYSLDKQIVLKIIIDWDGLSLDYQITPPENIAVTNLDLLTSATSNESSQANGKSHVKRIYTYKFKGQKVGAAKIGELQISYKKRLLNSDKLKYSESETLKTSPLTVTILPPPEHINIPWRLIVSVIALIFFVTIFIWFFRRNKKEKTPVIVQKNSPLMDFKKSVNQLQSKLIEGELQQYFAALQSEFEKFIKNFTAQNNKGLKDEELISELNNIINEQDVVVLKAFLKTAHLVKFAGFRPETEEVERQAKTLLRIAEKIEKNQIKTE